MPKSVRGVMHEWKNGALHSGAPSGPVVRNPKQAIAIALSEQKAAPKRQLPPALKQRARMVKDAHHHLAATVPEYSQVPAAQRMMMQQHHVNLRLGKVR